jgi:hypothetical protein
MLAASSEGSVGRNDRVTNHCRLVMILDEALEIMASNGAFLDCLLPFEQAESEP